MTMNDMTMNNPSAANGGLAGRRLVTGTVIGLAAALQLVVLVPFTVASGLLAPLWAVVLLYAVWLAGATMLVRTARSRPLVTPVVPLVNAAVVWSVITLGEVWLGWTG